MPKIEEPGRQDRFDQVLIKRLAVLSAETWSPATRKWFMKNPDILEAMKRAGLESYKSRP